MILTILKLDLQHQLFLMAFEDKLHLAPLEDLRGGIQNVIDIATGTGIWAIDFGSPSLSSFLLSRRSCKFVSKHISIRNSPWHRFESHSTRIVKPFLMQTVKDIKTDGNSVPPNCHFEVDDAEDPWTYPQQFDFVHGRMLASCFKSHLEVFRSAFTALRPGGFLELQDSAPFECIDNSDHGTAFERWKTTCLQGVAALGRDFNQVCLPVFSCFHFHNFQ
jgi:SAM-dependent methyltransferase